MKDGYNNHSEWKKSYNRRGNNYVFVEYNPGDIVRDADKYIYSTINPTEVIATIKYSKPVCTGADAGKWVITAEPKPGYRFNRWSGGDFNGVTDNPLKGEVDQTMPATAFVDRIIYSVSLGSNNETMGTIGYNSELSAYYNEYMPLTATANTGYKFVRWSNGHSENPYYIRITSDTTLTAMFVVDDNTQPGGTTTINDTVHDTIYIHDTVGVDDVKAVNLKLYQRNGRIVVSGADGADVRLYDAVGRLLATKQDNYSELEFDVPASGAYLIRVGNLNARRIVVVR